MRYFTSYLEKVTRLRNSHYLTPNTAHEHPKNSQKRVLKGYFGKSLVTCIGLHSSYADEAKHYSSYGH